MPFVDVRDLHSLGERGSVPDQSPDHAGNGSLHRRITYHGDHLAFFNKICDLTDVFHVRLPVNGSHVPFRFLRSVPALRIRQGNAFFYDPSQVMAAHGLDHVIHILPR